MAHDEIPYIVLKFGGTSVSSKENWDTIKGVMTERMEEGLKPIVVCSALSKMSDSLEKLLDLAQNGGYELLLTEIKARHERLANELDVDFTEVLGESFEELSRLALGISLTKEVSPQLHARIMAFGELMSTKLGAAYLNTQGIKAEWMDARKFLHSVYNPHLTVDRRYLSSACEYDQDPELLAELAEKPLEAIITQGFIARDKAGETVLLGRGGSDTSAAYFAAKTSAKRLEIWTDVPGVFTANPKNNPQARLIKSLDYQEAQEITSTGAKVLHPRCIRPVAENDIPLHIRCTENPEILGTVISSQPSETEPLLKVISSMKGVMLVSMENVDMWQTPGFLARAFQCFKAHELSIDLVSTSQTNVTVSLDGITHILDKTTLDSLAVDLSEFCTVKIIGPSARVSLVGENIRAILHQLGPAMKVFEEKDIYLVSQASSDVNFSFVVDEEEGDRLVEQLHALLLQDAKDDTRFGPTWEELFEKPQKAESEKTQQTIHTWWPKRKEELIRLAKNNSPLFVYDEQTLEGSMNKLLGMEAVDKVFYAIKANWHETILRKFHDAGLGFECVSKAEVEYVKRLFPEIDPKRILFTPNFAPKEEYKFGLAERVNVTLDNIHPLECWPEIFQGREVFVRMDPGRGRGHHKHVQTAGAKAKFGVWPEQLETLITLSQKNDTRITGLHAHAGSGIRTSHNWKETALFLVETAERIGTVKTLDLGGGLGIPEKPGQEPLNIADVDDSLQKVKEAYQGFELWLEPGRFLVAEAGVLLSRVTQLKTKGGLEYVGLDVGMNTLIRPALYGSYHEIQNLSKLGRPKDFKANIVGPICETGDTFGHNRRIARPDEGDVFLIATAGAYGRVMSSEYNMRPPAEEYFLKKSVSDAP